MSLRNPLKFYFFSQSARGSSLFGFIDRPPAQQLFSVNKRMSGGSGRDRIPPKCPSPATNPALSAQSADFQLSIVTKEPHAHHFPQARRFHSTMPGEVAVLRFVKLTEKAHPPAKGSELAAGYDLKSAYDYVIPARGKELVKTDLQIQLPEGCYGRVAPRSGLAWKHHIDVGAGVIDADYTGNVGVVMFNHGAEDFHVKAGDRVAQLICEKICYPDLQEVNAVSETARGDGGFGSTGRS